MIALLQEEGRGGLLWQRAACMQSSKLALFMVEISYKQMKTGVCACITCGITRNFTSLRFKVNLH